MNGINGVTLVSEGEQDGIEIDPEKLRIDAQRQALADEIFDSPAARAEGERYDTYQLRRHMRNTLHKAYKAGTFIPTRLMKNVV